MHLRNGGPVEVAMDRHPGTILPGRRTLVEQAVVAQFVAISRCLAPLLQAQAHRRCGQGQIETALQPMPVQGRDRIVQLRIQRVIIGQAHRRIAALWPGEAITCPGDLGEQRQAGKQGRTESRRLHPHLVDASTRP